MRSSGWQGRGVVTSLGEGRDGAVTYSLRAQTSPGAGAQDRVLPSWRYDSVGTALAAAANLVQYVDDVEWFDLIDDLTGVVVGRYPPEVPDTDGRG